MELMWIIFVTFLAVAAAYCAGGYLDRKTRARQEQEERHRREEYLSLTAEFARGFSGLLVGRGLANKEAAFEISCLLCQYLEKYSEESYAGEEWEQLKNWLHATKEQP